MAHDVFISHSSKDKFTADAICHALEQNSIPCWIAPRDVRAGFDYPSELIFGIENCKLMVLLFSEESNKSPFVYAEVERAFAKSKMIIPYRLSQVEMSRNLEFILSVKHWIDAYPNDTVFAGLIVAVKNALGISVDNEVKSPQSQIRKSIKPNQPINNESEAVNYLMKLEYPPNLAPSAQDQCDGHIFYCFERIKQTNLIETISKNAKDGMVKWWAQEELSRRTQADSAVENPQCRHTSFNLNDIRWVEWLDFSRHGSSPRAVIETIAETFHEEAIDWYENVSDGRAVIPSWSELDEPKKNSYREKANTRLRTLWELGYEFYEKSWLFSEVRVLQTDEFDAGTAQVLDIAKLAKAEGGEVERARNSTRYIIDRLKKMGFKLFSRDDTAIAHRKELL